MARNVVRTRVEGVESKPAEAPIVASSPLPDVATMPGGAPGVPEDPNLRSALIHGLDDIAPARSVEPEQNLQPKRWRVVGGPSEVMYEGARLRVMPGKVYPDNCVDLDLLRRQGVQLQEVSEQQAV